MKKFLKFLLFNILLASPFPVLAKETIHVALTSIQPPFVFDDAFKSGLVRDLVTEMNASQDRYNFVIDLYPTMRLVKDHESLHIDLIAFNDLRWGWDKQGGKGSLALTHGKDVFFSFPAISKKNQIIAAVRGFHYKFSAFDPDNLENNPNVNLLENESSVTKFLSYGRAEKGIASIAYLNWLSVSQPGLFKQIKILEEDHSYSRRFIIMPSSLISVKEVNDILLKLKSNGSIQQIFAQYGQTVPSLD